MTLGQERVGVDFNPSKQELVDIIKSKSAELIDLCEKMRVDASSEKNRRISLAQTHFETASMFAVKANFAK